MANKRYTVTVITGTKQHADTRANVYIKIQGTLGVSPEAQLPGEFGTGTTREFTVESPDLGALKSIDIRHDGTGNAPAWFLDKVLIKDETGAVWVFPAGQWISDTITRTLAGELLKPGTEVPSTLWTGWAWGRNDLGQLGDGTNKQRSAPTRVPYLDRVGFNALSAGGFFSTAVLDDGGVWAWGVNDWSQLGDGTDQNRYAPVDVMHVERFGVRALASGGWFNLALLKDGTAWAWGAYDYSQLGAGDTGFTEHNIPVEVVGLSGVKALAGGGWHSLALLEDGTVWSWGHNAQGQLGSGAVNDRNKPAKVEGLSGVKAIAAGYRHSLALLEDGTLMAWGFNNYGQLGDGTTTQRNTPVKVATIGKVKAIAAGHNNVGTEVSYSLALLEDGTVWAWGANDWHQLGDGTSTHRNTPVRVGDLTGVKAIAAGGWHGLALHEDGTVSGWGANDYGQVGAGSTTPNRYAKPVKLQALSGIKAIAAGGWHSLAGG